MEGLKNTNDQHQDQIPKLLSLIEVIDIVGISKSRIYSLMALNLFPRPIKCGIHRVSWLEPEIDAYITQKIEERNKKYSGKVGA